MQYNRQEGVPVKQSNKGMSVFFTAMLVSVLTLSPAFAAEKKAPAAPAAVSTKRVMGSDPQRTAQSLKTIAALSKTGALKSLARTANKGGAMKSLKAAAPATAAPAAKAATTKDTKKKY